MDIFGKVCYAVNITSLIKRKDTIMVKKKTNTTKGEEDLEFKAIEAEAWGEDTNDSDEETKKGFSFYAVAFWSVIMGICKAFAVASIVYSAVIIFTTVDDSFAKYAVIPACVLALSMAFKAFVIIPLKLLMEKNEKSS